MEKIVKIYKTFKIGEINMLYVLIVSKQKIRSQEKTPMFGLFKLDIQMKCAKTLLVHVPIL